MQRSTHPVHMPSASFGGDAWRAGSEGRALPPPPRLQLRQDSTPSPEKKALKRSDMAN